MCTDMYWCVHVCVDVYWCELMHIIVYCCVLMCANVHWCVHMCTDMYCFLLMWTDLYWCVLMCIDVYWCGLMHCLILQLCLCVVCVIVLVSTVLHWFAYIHNRIPHKKQKHALHVQSQNSINRYDFAWSLSYCVVCLLYLIAICICFIDNQNLQIIVF